MVEIKNDDYRKKLILFFVATFVISWSFWILAPFISFGDHYLFAWIVVIGGFGPSISAIIITSRMESHSRIEFKDDKGLKKKKWLIFCIIFCISFLSGMYVYLGSLITSFYFIPLVIVASLIATFLITRIYSSNSSLSQLLHTIKGVKGKKIYLLYAFLIPLLISVGSIIISVILGGTLNPEYNLFLLILILPLNAPYIIFYGGPLNEEIGWRGFATPRMQERYSPLITGLIIGIIWSTWHLPLHFNGAYGFSWFGLLMRFVWNIPHGIIFIWYYNKSQKNLLGVIILHTSLNLYHQLIGIVYGTIITYIYSIMYYAFLLFIIVKEKMWKKLPIEEN